MSTKIYNAYKLSKFKSLDEIFHAFQTLRPGLNALIERNMSSNYAKIAMGAISESIIHPDDEAIQKKAKSPLTYALRDDTDYAEIYPKPTLTLVVYPFEGEYYMTCYTACIELQDEVVDFFEADNFEYWNNTDRPDELTEEEWEERSEIWDAILEDPRPNHNGVVFELDPKNGIPNVDLIIKHEFPDYPSRVLSVATHRLIASKGLNSGNGNHWTQVWNEMKKAIPGSKEEKILSEVRNLLPKKLTREILFDGIK